MSRLLVILKKHVRGCLGVSIAVERRRDHDNSYKEKHLSAVVPYSSGVQSMLAGSMTACRQAQCQRNS